MAAKQWEVRGIPEEEAQFQGTNGCVYEDRSPFWRCQIWKCPSKELT